MLRCNDRRGWVDHPWESPDPEVIEESLKILYLGTTGTYCDAYWPYLIEIDWEEILRQRTEQKAYLMRYGRQDWFSWEHREVRELKEACDALNEIMKEENKGVPNVENM